MTNFISNRKFHATICLLTALGLALGGLTYAHQFASSSPVLPGNLWEEKAVASSPVFPPNPWEEGISA